MSLQLAEAARDLPLSQPRRQWAPEPKFDGWRAALFVVDGVLQSRRENNLADRFPEIMELGPVLGDVVVDGEVVALRAGRLDFAALASRPQARVAAGVTIYYVVFDLLADDRTDGRRQPYRARRERLGDLLADVDPPLQLAPSTINRETALGWMRPDVSAVGIEGVVAKPVDGPYRAGRTGGWVKIRQMAIVDAVVVGVTGDPAHPLEVVLGRRDPAGELHRIGLSMPLTSALRDQVGAHVRVTGEPAVRVPTGGFGRGQTEYLPTVPELVVEVEAEASIETFTNRLRPRVYRLRAEN
ncbi:hypothetical protein [Amycolatopsis sp. NPDC051903]|uniref:ATP-dependent DNA ligase n=1 Tax=Amycolatopsis sp. NPDC051903 TaxID=3363936 RepID=UPI0037B4333D